MTPRSWLFVPADSAQKLSKAPVLGADTLILDLEDSILQERKSEAREMASRFLSQAPNMSIWVRVNNVAGQLEEDLLAAVTSQTQGIVLPKVTEAATAAAVSAQMAEIEAERGIEIGRLDLLPMVETSSGVLNALEIASIERVDTLMMGQYDLAAELGVTVTKPDGLRTARALLVLACAAAGKKSPVGPVSTQIRDVESFRASTLQLREEGHWGRAVIHPSQIGPVNEVFSPAGADLDAYNEAIDALDRAQSDNRGAAVDRDGNLVDIATLKLFQRRAMQPDGDNEALGR